MKILIWAKKKIKNVGLLLLLQVDLWVTDWCRLTSLWHHRSTGSALSFLIFSASFILSVIWWLALNRRCCSSEESARFCFRLPCSWGINRFLWQNHSSPGTNTSPLKDSQQIPLCLLGQDQRSRCLRCKLVKGWLICLSSLPLTAVINLI